MSIDDDDMILFPINGLPPEYNPFRSALHVQNTSLNFEELLMLLKAEEQMLESQIISDLSGNSAFVSFGPQSAGGCGQYAENKSSSYPSNNSGNTQNSYGRGRGKNDRGVVLSRVMKNLEGVVLVTNVTITALGIVVSQVKGSVPMLLVICMMLLILLLM